MSVSTFVLNPTIMPRTIYLDNNATTPVDPRVVAAMQPYYTEVFGNAASGHVYGWQAKAVVEKARAEIAAMIGAPKPDAIIFTSGATESNNLALQGTILPHKQSVHIISQTTEHSSVLETLKALTAAGHEVTFVGVDAEGRVNMSEFAAAFRPNTTLVSVMAANNEIGTLQNIAELVKITRRHPGVLFHCDGAQAVGKISLDVTKLDVDLLSFSAHKIYGPKGIGALYVAPRRPKILLRPLLYGGGHEGGVRSGTLNVPAILGFAAALKICVSEMIVETSRQIALRDYFVKNILAALDFTFLNGSLTERLPNNVNLCFEGVSADELMLALPELAVASGAACSSGGTEPSHVIQALGKTREQAKSSLRVSLGRFTTEQEVEKAMKIIVAAVKKLREKSLVYEMMKTEFASPHGRGRP